MKKSLLLGAALTMAAGAMAQLTPGEYYIKNVETGMFLNEGWSWGTHGVVKAYPMAFQLTTGQATNDEGWLLLGNEDNTSPFFGARSTPVDINGDGSVHYEFYNYHCVGANNWDNWILVLTNGIPFGAEGYSEYLVLRADAFGWGTAYDKDNLKSDFNWDTFVAEMEGALVNIDITRTGSDVEVYAKVKAKDGTERFESITLEGVSSEILGTFLTCEKSHLFIKPQEGYVEDTKAYLKSAAGYIKADGPWMDGSLGDTAAATIEKTGDAYTIKIGDNYLTVGAPETYLNYIPLNIVDYTAAPDGNKSAWELLTKEDMIKALEGADADNPKDASFFLKAGDIQWATDNYCIANWHYTKNGKPAEIVIAQNGWQKGDGFNDELDRSVYAWCQNDGADGAIEGTDVVYQDVTGMPAGKYKAEYRVVNQNNTPLVVKFNETEGKPYDMTEDVDDNGNMNLWYKGAWEAIVEHSETADFTVGEDGKLSLRMEKTIDPAHHNRFAFKSIALYYLGNGNSAVKNIAIDENAPVEYYNMQGIRVANPTNGLYIKRQGKTATKVLVK